MGYASAKRKHFDLSCEGECSQMSPQQRCGRSKAAQILFTKALQRRFDEKNIGCTCSCLHPGGVRTRIFDTYGMAYMAVIYLLWPFMIETEEGARTSVFLATTDQRDEIGGKHFYYGLFLKGIYEKNGSALLNDQELQEFVWTKSEALVGDEFHIA